MWDIEENIDKIVEEGDKAEMNKLSEILEDVIDVLREYDEEMYEKYAMCIYKMANGYNLTLDMAKHIVKNMKPFGEHWTIEQTTAVKNQYGFTDITDIDFWVVMNSAYNDYNEIFRDNVEVYAKWSHAFIKDEDSREGKVFTYFTKIPKE